MLIMLILYANCWWIDVSDADLLMVEGHDILDVEAVMFHILHHPLLFGHHFRSSVNNAPLSLIPRNRESPFPR